MTWTVRLRVPLDIEVRLARRDPETREEFTRDQIVESAKGWLDELECPDPPEEFVDPQGYREPELLSAVDDGEEEPQEE